MKRRDVIFILVGIFAIAAVLYPFATARSKSWAESVSCGNYISSIALASRVWADDNNQHMADNFLCMSNELATPKILICPSDKDRKPAEHWTTFTTNNCSYEILRPGMPESDTTNAYFRCTIHGHLGFADGTAFDGKQRRTKW